MTRKGWWCCLVSWQTRLIGQKVGYNFSTPLCPVLPSVTMSFHSGDQINYREVSFRVHEAVVKRFEPVIMPITSLSSRVVHTIDEASGLMPELAITSLKRNKNKLTVVEQDWYKSVANQVSSIPLNTIFYRAFSADFMKLSANKSSNIVCGLEYSIFGNILFTRIHPVAKRKKEKPN